MRSLLLTVISAVLCFSASAQLRSDFDREMNAPAEPFTIINNIHYVGTADLAIFLITTPEGHILIDAGFRETVPQITSNVEKLGFSVSDIKVILTNHTHPDHAGGLAAMKELTGARVLATKRQKKQLKRGGTNDFRFGDEMSFDKVKSKASLRHGERFGFGGMRILVHETPGHTKDCVSFSTTTDFEGSTYQVMFAGSLSSLDYDFVGNKKYKKHAKEFQSTFDYLRTLKVDIFLTSHAQFFDVERKRELLKSNPPVNPFYDPNGYRKYVEDAEKSFRSKLQKQKQSDS